MTFGNFAKRQLWFEPVINTWDLVGTFHPSFSGVLKSVRLRYIITENFAEDFSLSVRFANLNDSTVILDTSNVLSLDDFTKPSIYDFHQGWIRLDFAGNEVMTKDIGYGLYLNYACSSYTTLDNKFIMFAVDSPLRTYETDGDQNPFVNGYADIQIYLERPYDDFN
jgi:hypothetical protein